MEAKQDLTVRVTKQEVVKAVLPMQEHRLALSNLDLLLPPVDFAVFFCYKKPTGGDKEETFGSMAGVLKKAMAQTLVSYYAFAGEIVPNSVGEPQLLCNSRGVDFVEAFANVELKNLNFYNPDESVEGKLVPKRKHGVLSVQATGLKCGGIVVACTFHHQVEDAYSANMFLVSWAKMAQSKPISQLPNFLRSHLSPRRPGSYNSIIDEMYAPILDLPLPDDLNRTAPVDEEDDQLISRIYYIKASRLRQLQILANNGNELGKRTKLEAFTALLWKLLSAGEDSCNNKTCRMGIVVDGRRRLNTEARTMVAYLGNVLSIPFGEKTSAELRKKPLSWVADAVHEFLFAAVTKEHFLSLIDWVEAQRPKPVLAKIYAGDSGGMSGRREEGPTVVVSSGQRFPVEKVEFGWGKPAFGSYHFPWGGKAGYVMPMPSPMENGDWVVYMHLLKGHLDLVETKVANVFRPLTSHYLKL